jgi:non-ribosomal peptide synthetase component E (peptide arylation enzyme)
MVHRDKLQRLGELVAADCQNTILVTKAFEIAPINTARRELFFEGRAAIITLKKPQLTACDVKSAGKTG